MRRIALPLLALLATLGQTDTLFAQCASPNLIDSIPPDGANNVPVAWEGGLGLYPLVARYDIGAVHAGEPVVFQRARDPRRSCDGDSGPWCLAGAWDSQSLTLSVAPPEGFQPGEEYVVVWPGLRSISDQSLQGDETTVRFTVGNYVDTEHPSFEGLTSVEWDFERKYDSCSDTDAERYVFDVGLGEPTDDGGTDLLMLRVFQTRGPTLNGIPTEVHVQRYTERDTATFKLPISDGVGQVCFSALVSDPGGNFSSSANREACTRTVAPPFFDGCALAKTRNAHPARSGLPLLGLLLAVGLRRKRRFFVRSTR